MLSEFKTFIARGNVLDLAVGISIGAAVGKIVAALTDDILMPIIGWITGGVDFSNRFLQLGAIPADFKGDPNSYADLKSAGVAMIGAGSFVTAIINFVIIAFAIFLVVRQANKVIPKAPEAPAGPTEVELLTEIRDALKK
jgi:large conductance mechanosensitive channel